MTRMNNITLYCVLLHNSNHYRRLSQAAAGFSAGIAQRLESMAGENLKLAEIFYDIALSSETVEVILPVTFYRFDVNFDREPKDYIIDLLDAVIEAEEYLESIYKEYDLKHHYNIAFFRKHDFLFYKKSIEDGSIFGDTGQRIDFVCTACGYVDRVGAGSKYMRDQCKCCGAGIEAFIRRPSLGGW